MDNNRNNIPPNGGSGDDKKPKGNVWVALTIAIMVVLLIGTVSKRGWKRKSRSPPLFSIAVTRP